MTLAHDDIAIPNQINGAAPDATPGLFNEQYTKCLQNDQGLDERLSSTEEEMGTARGSESSLGERFDVLEADVSGFNPDMQNALIATIMEAVDAAGLANRELDRLKTVLIQEGERTIMNRGVIGGLSISKSDTATRNLSLSAGQLFAHGRKYSVTELLNTAAVPANNTAEAATCYVYLWIGENGDVQCDCTSLGDPVPENGIAIYSVSVPAGNNESTDPYLTNCALADIRRLEPNWPQMLENPAFVYVSLANILPDSDYTVETDVVSLEGGRQQAGELQVEDRLRNGFKLYLTGAADAVAIRYIVTRLKG